MITDERRSALLEKLAADASLGSMLFGDSPGKSLGSYGRSLVGDTTKGVLKDVLSEQLKERLKPKPSVGKMIFGRGGALKKALAFGAVAAGIGGGVSLADKAVDAVHGKFSKRKGFNDMMEANPQFKNQPKKDVQGIYNTLYNFAPKMARDPLVAGSFMKKQLEFKTEGIQAPDLKTLSEITRNLGQARKESILSRAFGAAGAAPGMES